MVDQAKKKILVVTNSFPKPEKKQWGIFIAQTLDELEQYFDIEVVNPVPWFPRWKFLSVFTGWYEFAKVPPRWAWKNIGVSYPRFFSIPKITQALQVIFVVFSILLLFLKKKNRQLEVAIIGFYLFPEGVAAVILGKIFNIPVILSARGSDVNIEANHFWKRQQIKWALENAQGVTAVSRDLCRKIEDILSVTKTVTYIHNGVDQSLFGKFSKKYSRDKIGLCRKTGVMVFVGRLVDVKGLTFLLEALHVLEMQGKLNFTTYLIGDGPLRKILEVQSQTLKIKDKVIFKGVLEHSEIPLWLSAADLFCLPSLNEGQPNVVLESLASGTPVVASNVGGIPDLITKDVGLLFTPADTAEMAVTIRRGMDRSWDEMQIKEHIEGFQWG